MGVRWGLGTLGYLQSNQNTPLQKEFLLLLQLLICRHLLSPQQDCYDVLPKLMSSEQGLARFSDLFDMLPIFTSPRDSAK